MPIRLLEKNQKCLVRKLIKSIGAQVHLANNFATSWRAWCFQLSDLFFSLRYRLTVLFLECRYRLRMLVLHLGNLRVRVHQALLYYKLMLLYLLDKGLCLSVLRSLNQVSDKSRDLRDGFECCHNGDRVKPPIGETENNQKLEGLSNSEKADGTLFQLSTNWTDME